MLGTCYSEGMQGKGLGTTKECACTSLKKRCEHGQMMIRTTTMNFEIPNTTL